MYILVYDVHSYFSDVYLRAGDPNFGDRLKLVIRATNRIGVITETITFVVVRAKTFTNASHIQETYVTGEPLRLQPFSHQQEVLSQFCRAQHFLRTRITGIGRGVQGIFEI